jgi:hypothetical protein
MKLSIHEGALGCCGVLIISSCVGIRVCHPNVPLDIMSPRVHHHYQSVERLCTSWVVCAAADRSILRRDITIIWMVMLSISMVVHESWHRHPCQPHEKKVGSPQLQRCHPSVGFVAAVIFPRHRATPAYR